MSHHVYTLEFAPREVLDALAAWCKKNSRPFPNGKRRIRMKEDDTIVVKVADQ